MGVAGGRDRSVEKVAKPSRGDDEESCSNCSNHPIMSESPNKRIRKNPENALDALKALTVVVADTGDVASIDQYKPQDATTNPSLIFKAAQMASYASLLDEAVTFAKGKSGDSKEQLDWAMDRLAVNFGCEISKIVPGYVSTEVDARLSFDTEETVARARRIIAMYAEKGVDKSRILIKIASTYEGIRAGEILEKEGITCNLTLLFSLTQAAACAEADITLISPFVGRILDWYKKKEGDIYNSETDPGVVSVKSIYHYFKKFGYNTIVMGASFRNTGELLELAGCDRLTIAPTLLQQLSDDTSSNVTQKLDANDTEAQSDITKIKVDEKSFRFQMNEDAMATEKLAEGIRGFSADLIKLEKIVAAKF